MARSNRKRYPPVTIDVNRLRRNMVWGIPMCVVMLWGCWWLAAKCVSEIVALRRLEATVEVTPAAVVIPIFALMLCLVIVLATLRAIPWERPLTRAIEMSLLWVSLVGFFTTMVLILVISVTQNHYMPEWGYTKCKTLAGSTNRWSSVWVKSPDWCVKGKTREWVNEQARSSRQ